MGLLTKPRRAYFRFGVRAGEPQKAVHQQPTTQESPLSASHQHQLHQEAVVVHALHGPITPPTAHVESCPPCSDMKLKPVLGLASCVPPPSTTHQPCSERPKKSAAHFGAFFCGFRPTNACWRPLRLLAYHPRLNLWGWIIL